jgi:hypothetical protein
MHVGRWDKRIGLGAVVGVLATVGVAWWYGVSDQSSVILRRATTGSDALLEEERDGQRIRVVDERLGFGHRWRIAGWVGTGELNGTDELRQLPTVPRPSWLPAGFEPCSFMSEEHCGWPWLAMKSGEVAAFKPYRSMSWPVLVLRTREHDYSVPLVPLFPGFALDTPVFGGLYVVVTGAV